MVQSHGGPGVLHGLGVERAGAWHTTAARKLAILMAFCMVWASSDLGHGVLRRFHCGLASRGTIRLRARTRAGVVAARCGGGRRLACRGEAQASDRVRDNARKPTDLR